MSISLVPPSELSRNVARQYEIQFEPSPEKQGFMHQTVLKVMSIYTKFVSHSFKKEGCRTVSCDVPLLGQFIMEKPEDPKQKCRYDFIPSMTLQSECLIKKTQSGIQFSNDSSHSRKELTIGKIAEVGQIDIEQAQRILNLMIKSIGTFVRSGRQVALDVQLQSGDKYLLVSQTGYDIKDKNGIAENLQDILSMSNRRSQLTDSSSLHAGNGQGERDAPGYYSLPGGREEDDRVSVAASSTATSYKKRKLSIALANSHQTPQKGVTPRDLERRGNNTIDRNRYTGGNLDQKSLARLGGDSGQLDLDALSVHSGLFTSKASQISSKYHERFPSIQPEDRRKNGYGTSDILSQSSRLSKVSKVISRAGSHLSGSQVGVAPSQAGSRFGESDQQSIAGSTRSPGTIFMNPADHLKQKASDNKLVQEDLLEKILLRKRQEHLLRKKAELKEQKDVNQVFQDYQAKVMQDKTNKVQQQKSLKERLIEQKLERLNRDSKDQEERHRPQQGYHPFGKNKDKGLVGRFDATLQTDSRHGDVGWEYDGQGESVAEGEESNRGSRAEGNDDTLSKFNHLDKHEKVTYKLLQQDLSGREVIHAAEERVGERLEQTRQQKIIERIEFEKQIEQFTQKELLKELQKKELLRANKDFWEKQIQWTEAKKKQAKVQDLHGGSMPNFLNKMFKYQEQLDINEDADLDQTMPNSETNKSRQQRSRMHYNKESVQDLLREQIEEKQMKLKIDKYNDLQMGQQMSKTALQSAAIEEEFMRQKKAKAQQVMNQQWDEQLKLKSNEEVVNRVFV